MTSPAHFLSTPSVAAAAVMETGAGETQWVPSPQGALTVLGVEQSAAIMGDEEEQTQLADCVDTARHRLAGLPARIQPPGLSADRRAYLRQHIRPFVRPDAQDILCP